VHCQSARTVILGSLPFLLQGEAVKLGNAHAALLEGQGATWAEALAEEAAWELVQVLRPQPASAPAS
jgi:hypothetical protein